MICSNMFEPILNMFQHVQRDSSCLTIVLFHLLDLSSSWPGSTADIAVLGSGSSGGASYLLVESV